MVRRVLYLSLKEFKTAQKSKVENGTGIVNGEYTSFLEQFFCDLVYRRILTFRTAAAKISLL